MEDRILNNIHMHKAHFEIEASCLPMLHPATDAILTRGDKA
jgi:hypothetical protein